MLFGSKENLLELEHVIIRCEHDGYDMDELLGWHPQQTRTKITVEVESGFDEGTGYSEVWETDYGDSSNADDWASGSERSFCSDDFYSDELEVGSGDGFSVGEDSGGDGE